VAGIDKIYGTEGQLVEFREWLEANKPEFLDMVNDPSCEFYRKPHDESDLISISNFTEEADIWLYNNCPIKFVTDRISEQYDGNPIEGLSDE
jgi:hypothetical protein